MRNNTFTLQVETENGHCVKEISAHDRWEDPTKWETLIGAAMCMYILYMVLYLYCVDVKTPAESFNALTAIGFHLKRHVWPTSEKQSN